MFCPYCGEHLPENAKYCPSCGAKTGEKDSYDATYAHVDDTTAGSSHPINVILIVGFVLSMLFVPIAGLVCSYMGYKHADPDSSWERPLGIAGIVVGAVATGIFAIGLLLCIAMLLPACSLMFFI